LLIYLIGKVPFGILANITIDNEKLVRGDRRNPKDYRKVRQGVRQASIDQKTQCLEEDKHAP